MLQRLRFLAKLNLLPAMFGSVSISTTGDMMMAQRYTGDVTILPRVGGPRAFLNSIQNPDRPQMRSFIREGMKAANKHLSHMLHLLALEQALLESQATLLAARDARRDAAALSAAADLAGRSPRPSLRRNMTAAIMTDAITQPLHRSSSEGEMRRSSSSPKPQPQPQP